MRRCASRLPRSAIGQRGRAIDAFGWRRVGGDTSDTVEVTGERAARSNSTGNVATDHPRRGDLRISQRCGVPCAPRTGSLATTPVEFLLDERGRNRDVARVAKRVTRSRRAQHLACRRERAGGLVGASQYPDARRYEHDDDNEAGPKRCQPAAVMHGSIV